MPKKKLSETELESKFQSKLIKKLEKDIASDIVSPEIIIIDKNIKSNNVDKMVEEIRNVDGILYPVFLKVWLWSLNCLRGLL